MNALTRKRRFSHLWVGSNLKMYKTNRQLLEYVKELQKQTVDLPQQEITLFILVPYTGLADICRVVDKSRLMIGAQNMHWMEKGQYTGEISPIMLQDVGVELVMLGHAERREKFNETDENVNKCVRSSVAHNFQTLICVGETYQDKTHGISIDRLRQQIKIALFGITEEQLEKIWIAYEPVWAIGEEGVPCDPSYANEMHSIIRETLSELFPEKGREVPVFYGGSINPDNCVGFISQSEIDGLFIGRAAWDAVSFNKILRQIIPAWEQKNIT